MNDDDFKCLGGMYLIPQDEELSIEKTQRAFSELLKRAVFSPCEMDRQQANELIDRVSEILNESSDE